MEEATYSFGGAAKILDIAESKLRYWAQVGFVGPSGRRGGKPVFSFQDLVSVKAAKELVDRGFKAAEIRKAIEGVRAALPHLDRPLDRHARRVRRHAPGRRRRSRPRSSRAASACSTSASPSWPTRSATRPAPERRRGARAARRAVPLPEPPKTGQAEGEGDVHARAQRLRLVRRGDARRGGGRRRRARRDLLPRGARARSGAGGRAHQPGRARLPRRRQRPRRATRSRRRWRWIPISPRRASTWRTWCSKSGDLELAVAEFRRVLQADPGVRRRALQPGRRARTPGRPLPGARPPRTLPGARADDLQLGRPGPRPHRPPGLARSADPKARCATLQRPRHCPQRDADERPDATRRRGSPFRTA